MIGNDENTMAVITVKKSELLEALIKNKEEHRKMFLKAQDGYRVTVIEELDKMLKDAREGKEYRTSVHIPAPSDHTKDYERVVKMLTMSVKDEIRITEEEFSKYVMDDWGWKQEFTRMSANYVGKSRL